MRTTSTWIWTIASAAWLVGGSLQAAEPPKMTPEMEAMQKKAMELGAPNSNHKQLEPTIGRWVAKATFWMKPGDKPITSEGMSENMWILGGRFVKQEYKGTWQGQPFEGLGFTGYDNLRGEYQTLWLDNMMTGQMTGKGSLDAATRTIKIGGSFSCPMTGEKDRAYRSELKIVNNDKHTYTAYDKTAEGKEFKSMEIVYTRVK